MNYSSLPLRFVSIWVVALLSVVSAQAFEGKVALTMTTGKKVLPVTYYIKGLHLRTEMSLADDKKGNKLSAVAIFDMEAHEMLILMPEQKMYMTHHIQESDTQKSTAVLDFQPTGRKEKIAGYDTEEFAGLSEGKRTEIWVTKELGQFVMANQGKAARKASQSALWEKFLRDNNFFAMRTIQRAKEGAPEQFHMEVTSVEKTAEPDSLFQAPADFKKFEMPDIGGMMKGLIPGN